ncbi:MAG: type II toxin-antitoxin system VapC family toxin [Gemmatimonadetes bacterium]|nr:type II toxin-antitoxin system VapC family toxin [Gemmatimonadota bacterium]
MLLDTAALLWWMTDLGRLSPVARALTSSPARKLLVSAVSMWEVGTKMRRGRLELPVSFADFVTTVESLDCVTIVPVDLPVWMGVVNLEWDHRDPADRIIVSTAWRHRATLITSDRAIRAFYPDTAW